MRGDDVGECQSCGDDDVFLFPSPESPDMKWCEPCVDQWHSEVAQEMMIRHDLKMAEERRIKDAARARIHSRRS